MMVLSLVPHALAVPGYAEEKVPEIYAIPYPENYPTATDENGASAFAGSLDHPTTTYYVLNDFRNM